MILVLAHADDCAARSLVGRWSDHDARLLTCRDLSNAGWRYYPGEPESSRAVVDDRIVPFEEIDGVVTRLPSVNEDDLPHIVAADRGYVAAEMTAFLVAWLSEAAIPVVNRPTPTCLTGPNWRREQWLHAAALAGMRTRATRRLITPSRDERPEADDAPGVAATIVGDCCVGPIADVLAAQARRLAELAGVELLTVEFDGPERDAAFVRAYPGADVSQAEIADALADCFSVCRAAAVREGR